MTLDNPFTRHLRARLSTDDGREHDAQLAAAILAADRFAGYWDDVETLVIQVHRSKVARAVDDREWQELRGIFEEAYAPVASALANQWPSTRAGGKPVERDPFRAIIARPEAASFIDDWSAMQLLPATREALNRHLMDLGTLLT